MQVCRLFVICLTASLLTACAVYNAEQPPAPVYGRPYYDPYPAPYETNAAPQPPPADDIQTKPLDGLNKTPEIIEIKPEIPPSPESSLTPPVPETGALPDHSAVVPDPFANEQPTDGESMPETEPPAGESKPVETPNPVAPAYTETPKTPEALKPLETFAPQSPAIGSLLMAANENSESGNLDSAASSIERAIRIEPRNATLYYKLAVLRLKQSKPGLAENLARKAALLSVNDNPLKKHSWLLVANARELQNNIEGAKKAKLEAAKY